MPTTAPRCRRTSRRDLTHRHHIGILNDAVVDTLDDGQHSSIGDRTPIEYENAYYNGELLEPEDQPTEQTVRDPKGRYLPRQDRDNERDINPRDLEHAG